MKSVLANITTPIITVGPPSIIIVFNPYMFYTAMTVFMLTCCLICVHIILSCARRDKRLDAVTTRAVRRANAKSNDSK